MTLKDKLPELHTDIQRAATGRAIATRLHNIYEHSIVPEVKLSMQGELSKSSYDRASRLIPDINTIRMIVNKLAKVYDKDAVRKTPKDSDQKLVEYYEKEMDLDQKMRSANILLELNRGCAIEPYLTIDGPRLRVLTSYQCQPHSNDPDDPTRMTAFTKFLPDEVVTFKNSYGIETHKTVQVFRTYDAEQWIEWDSDNGYRRSGSHKVGMIPFIWINNSEFEILPAPPISDIDSAVLIPKTYAGLYYALKFSCHSITITTDLTLPKDAEFAPDIVIEAVSNEDGRPGTIQTLKPTADIDKALELLKDTFYAILDSRGIAPPQQNQRLERPNAAAAMIQNADSSSHIKKRCSFFQSIESRLWKLIAALHKNVWTTGALKSAIENKALFSDDFEVDVQYGEVRPVEIRKELLERLDFQMKMGLMTKRQALQELYPSYTERQIDDWLEEQEEDAPENEQEDTDTGLPVIQPAPGNSPGNNQADPGQDEPGA